MKTERILLSAGCSLGVIFCIILGILYSSSNSENTKLRNKNNRITKIATLNDSLGKAYQSEASMYKRWCDAANARIDTLSKIARNPDSLREVVEASMDRLSEANDSLKNKLDEANVEFQKKLAEAISKAGKSSKIQQSATTKNPTTTKGPEAKKVLITKLKLKGNPITNDKDSTFTYVKSDIALVAKFAPKGYTLVQKPR